MSRESCFLVRIPCAANADSIQLLRTVLLAFCLPNKKKTVPPRTARQTRCSFCCLVRNTTMCDQKKKTIHSSWKGLGLQTRPVQIRWPSGVVKKISQEKGPSLWARGVDQSGDRTGLHGAANEWARQLTKHPRRYPIRLAQRYILHVDRHLGCELWASPKFKIDLLTVINGCGH